MARVVAAWRGLRLQSVSAAVSSLQSQLHGVQAALLDMQRERKMHGSERQAMAKHVQRMLGALCACHTLICYMRYVMSAVRDRCSLVQVLHI
jgi:hypothetical protein